MPSTYIIVYVRLAREWCWQTVQHHPQARLQLLPPHSPVMQNIPGSTDVAEGGDVLQEPGSKEPEALPQAAFLLKPPELLSLKSHFHSWRRTAARAQTMA